MRVLVIGGGGREHALGWKLAQSPRVTELHCVPGNAGTAALARRADLKVDDFPNLIYYVKQHRIDLTVVGPEAPLCAGIVDAFTRAGLRIFGPSKRAAELEGSKVFAKELMRRRGIPTADFRVFRDLEAAEQYLGAADYPLVVKASGLAAGKGVTVCATPDEARDVVVGMMADRRFGTAGEEVVIEERLIGEEVSVLAFVDGRTVLVLDSAQDHKRLADGDRGPNTGGMGAYSPAPCLTEELSRKVAADVLVPLVHALNVEDRPYRGLLYAGLMLTRRGPQVLEFNCRFGDPETQPLLMRLQSDLLDPIEAVIDGRLDEVELRWDPRPAVGVVLAAPGYPARARTGAEIRGLDADFGPDVAIFHAGTERRGGRVVTAGGRVLCVTARGTDPSAEPVPSGSRDSGQAPAAGAAPALAAARRLAYAAVERLSFEGMQFRRDIALQAAGSAEC